MQKASLLLSKANSNEMHDNWAESWVNFIVCTSNTSFLYRGFMLIVQELCESQGGHPGLSVLTSLLVSVDVKIY